MYSRTSDDTSEELIRRIRLVLLQLGIPPTFAGYPYLCRMICRAYESPGEAELITKDLYPQTAREFHCSTIALDRACRRVLDQAYKRPYLCRTDGYSGRPGPCEFILLTAAKLRSGEL